MGWFSSLVGGVVGFFIGGPAGAVVGAGLGATKAGEKVVNTVLDFVLQPFMPKIPDIGNQSEAQRQQGVLLQTQGSTVNVPVVYGFRKLGGSVAFAETGSTNNKYLYVAYVFSEGLVEGLREVYIDDWLLPVDQVGKLNAGQLVTINADRYKDRVQLRWYPGVYYTDAKRSTVGTTVKGDIFSEAPSFTSDMVYNGLAVLFARYEWKEIKTQEDADNNPFSGNIPEVQVTMLGKRVASLLVDSTETQSYESTPVRYSTNPAECLLDYLRNPRYGKGLSNSDIDWTTWKRAARKCNQTVTYVASGIQGPILTLNMVVDTQSTIMSNTKLMLQNFRAYMPYVQGKYKLRIEDAGNETDILSGSALIVQTITKDDIISDITFNGIEKSAKYNVVSVTYVDPDQKWSNQQVVFPESEVDRQFYITQDGGRENKYDITLGGITNYAIAKDFARLIFNKQRRQESCIFTATGKALELEPGDCIRIQSNILNFGTDPWRVVSVKINNDMSVDVGCVRNPDDIYPYVRVGEEDIVLPTYVPKGSIIYFPGSSNQPPIGLVPPIAAVFPPKTTPPASNPAPTDPNAPGGGGVGGGPNAGPETVDPNVPVGGDNNTPTAPPPPPPFNATLSLKKTTAVIDTTTNTANFSLIFTQPQEALYSYSIFWWRLNRYSPWTEIRLDTLPGAGGDIPATIRGLPATYTTPYDYYVRSFATDGRASGFVVQGQFSLQVNQDTGQLVGTGSASTKQVTEGWQLPASLVPVNPVYDDDIDFLAIKPRLSSSEPQDPRRLNISIQQLQDTINKSLNPLIDGFIVYYRFKGDTYWSYERFRYSELNRSALQLTTIELQGDFGAKVYPGDVLFTANALQQYEFFVRLTYEDGTVAKKQMGPAQAPVEFSSVNYDSDGVAGYSFTAFGTSSRAVASVKSQLIPSSFTFQTVDQDPNKSFAQGSDIVPVIDSVRADSAKNKLTWTFTPPTNSRFRGYKIRYREVKPSENPQFVETPVVSARNIAGKVVIIVEDGEYRHNARFQWVITAQYSLNGVITDATDSIFATASIPYGISSGVASSWDLFDSKTIETAVALGNLRTAFPALPTPTPKSWIKKQVAAYNAGSISSNYGNFGADITANTAFSRFFLNTYYKFVFQPDGVSTHLIVYRRVYDSLGETKTTVTTTAKYDSLGAWERVQVALSDLTTNADGFKVINVRGPLDYQLFNTRYEVTGYTTNDLLYHKMFGPSPASFPNNGGRGAETDIYPYHGVGNGSSSSRPSRRVEFLFVLGTSSTEQTKALRLVDFYTESMRFRSSFQEETDGFSVDVSKDDIIDTTGLNGFTAGYGRNLDEAITAVPIGKLNFGFGLIAGATYGSGIPRSSTNYGYGPIDQFLEGPTNGDTVY